MKKRNCPITSFSLQAIKKYPIFYYDSPVGSYTYVCDQTHIAHMALAIIF